MPYTVQFRRKPISVTFPYSTSNSVNPPLLISLDRITTWQPGITYNGGIPTGRTQSGATITPIGQKASFTGSVTRNSGTLTVSGVTGTLSADQLVYDAALTTCFGYVVGGSGTTWNLNDGAVITATSVSMVSYGNDGTPISSALAAAADNTFVLLGAGTFVNGGNPIVVHRNNVTLRGTGQWTGNEITVGSFPPASPSSTIIWKGDHLTNPNALLALGFGVDAEQWTNSIDLAQDAVKGTKTASLVSAYAGSVGDLVIIDMIGDSDPLVWWGNRHDLSGYFNGTLNGTALSVNSIQNGPTGVDGTFNGTLNGTALTINSSTTGGYVQAGLPFGIQVGISIFDGSSNFKGYITGGSYPNFTLSQSNSNFTGALVLGGATPQIGYPVFDGKFSTFYGFISSGTYPNYTLNQSNPTLSNVALTVGGGTRRFFTRQERVISQIMMVASIDSVNKTVTFETPFHITFKTAFSAQIANPGNGFARGIGVENLTLYAGRGGDGNGNLPVAQCAYSWVKNVQALYSEGTGIGFYGCYRSEIRECYSHSTVNPNPGGAGYLSGLNGGTADCLIENNIFWGGNKVVVGRATGGGNVIAYNYMDDSFGASYPMSPEAGLNSGHYVGSHFDLIEGNYSPEYTADAFWGSSIYITLFRNWCSGLRAAANIAYQFQYDQISTNAVAAAGTNVLSFDGSSNSTDGIYNGLEVFDSSLYGVIPLGTTVTGKTTTSVTLSNNVTGAGVGNGDFIQFFFNGTLNNYSMLQSGTTYPFIDSWGRNMNNVQAHSYNHNLCANVYGYSGQGYKGFSTYNQDPAHGGVGYVYENLGTFLNPTGSDIEIYTVGNQQDPGQEIQLLNQDATLQRDGNWDWFTQSQRWHGVGGTVGSRQPVPIPNSYYLTATPAFWDTNPWPWVNPANGTTNKLPAKTRFEAMTGLTPIPPGNQ